MGRIGLAYYGEDIGSAVEDVEKVLTKIKSNLFTNEDLLKLVEANTELLTAVIRNENKD